MKAIILKNKIIESVGFIERAIGNNPHLPILKNILIKIEKNKIELSTTNLEFAITHILSGKIIEEGSITIPLNLFSTLIKNLTSERVTLEVKSKKLLITTDNYEASIQAQDAEEFPIIPSVNTPLHTFETSSKLFLDALLSVLPAIQYSEIRPEISGVFLTSHPDICFVGTDSFRLAERHFSDFKDENITEVRLIIPLKTAEEIARVFSLSKDEIVVISIDQTQIMLQTKELVIISRLIDGNFPDYKQIIPKEIKNEVYVNRIEFSQALKLVSSFSSKIHDVCIETGENGKYIKLSSSNSSLGENEYKIPAKLTGDQFKITFNWRFLLDGLKPLSDDEIIFGVNSADKPAIIRGATRKDFLYVVMPLKI